MVGGALGPRPDETNALWYVKEGCRGVQYLDSYLLGRSLAGEDKRASTLAGDKLPIDIVGTATSGAVQGQLRYRCSSHDGEGQEAPNALRLGAT